MQAIHEDNVPSCLNCGTRLGGQYCGDCGQRAESRLISLWVLLREAFGDLFELDSRLWRTLRPLLFRPGKLTRDYLEGRRARYMPPFRMYLVLSVIFFVVAFFDPREDLALLYVPEPAAPAETAAAAASDDAPLDCRAEIGDIETMPPWLQRRATPERLQKVCEMVAIDDGRAFANMLIDNLPVALIVLLPVMALILKMLYPLSRRYFVEHLLFFVHFHSFFFLMLTLQILFARVGYALPFVPEAAIVLILVAASFYIPVYLYQAMRVVYGQGHLVTVAKYSFLLVDYLIGVIMTFAGALLFALLSVGD